jgi:hypothetical protein
MAPAGRFAFPGGGFNPYVVSAFRLRRATADHRSLGAGGQADVRSGKAGHYEVKPVLEWPD